MGLVTNMDSAGSGEGCAQYWPDCNGGSRSVPWAMMVCGHCPDKQGLCVGVQGEALRRLSPWAKRSVGQGQGADRVIPPGREDTVRAPGLGSGSELRVLGMEGKCE